VRVDFNLAKKRATNRIDLVPKNSATFTVLSNFSPAMPNNCLKTNTFDSLSLKPQFKTKKKNCYHHLHPTGPQELTIPPEASKVSTGFWISEYETDSKL